MSLTFLFLNKNLKVVRYSLQVTPHAMAMLISYTIKPVLSEHIQQDILLAFFQTGGCLLLNESSAESSFLHYFLSAISNHRSIAIFMSPEWLKNGLTVVFTRRALA